MTGLSPERNLKKTTSYVSGVNWSERFVPPIFPVVDRVELKVGIGLVQRDQHELSNRRTIYTDGIRRSVGSRAGNLLDRAMDLLQAESAANFAEQVTRELLATGAEGLEDNLTLLIAKRDG